MLSRFLLAMEGGHALAFTWTWRGVQDDAGAHARAGIKATAIYGGKSPIARQRALEAFQRRLVQVLVETGIAV